MVFSSVIFLLFFLPIVLAGYHLLFLPVTLGKKNSDFWRRASNLFLLVVSLIFYFWGEVWLTWIVIASTLLDYLCALFISGAFHKGQIEELEEEAPRTGVQRAGVIISVVSNLSFLAFFKYFNFGVDTINAVIPEAWRFKDVIKVALPLGISFYTFQSMSYTIDVYRGHVKATRNLIDFACYVTLFPQLVAGPIVRYCDVASQLLKRKMSTELFASGVSRFVLGLGKKVLIANTVAQSADKIFALPDNQVTTPLAWIGIICYSIQLYFDFSGYSDMAIGLGRMFGFEFLENFNYPYLSRSIGEFWRRWHISLSTWFRDYLFIPMGGSRKSGVRTYFNLFTVFMLCGLWHGANWAFVGFGMYHGLFLTLERLGLYERLKKWPRVLQHLYAMGVLHISYLLFRCESFVKWWGMIKSLAGFAPSKAPLYVAEYLANDVCIALVYGIVFSMPVVPWFNAKCQDLQGGAAGSLNAAKVFGLALVLILCIMSLSASTHNPFIYFRF